MKSSKYQYRLVTAPGARFSVERASHDGSDWTRASLDCDTKHDSIVELHRLAEADDFVPEVVEL